MRDWHHKFIKLDEALLLLNTVSNPNNSIIIGLMEDTLEFKKINPTDVFGFDYEAANPGLSGATTYGMKKTIYMPRGNGAKIFPSTITSFSAHATSTAGIISARKDNALPTKGIVDDSLLVNFSASIGNLLLNTGIEFAVYSANCNALNIDYKNAGVLPYNLLTDSYAPPQLVCTVINRSATFPEVFWKDKNKNKTNEIRIAVSNLLDTIKSYSRSGRGVLFVVGAGNSNKNTTDEQYISNYKYPLVVAASCIDDKKVFALIKEERAGYSDYGERIDLCAPSNGNTSSTDKNLMYTTTTISGGEIGTDTEADVRIIVNQSSNDQLVLNTIEGVFAGNFVEIGDPTTINHEILLIKKVIKDSKTIVFDKPRYYTATPFSILPAQVKIYPLETKAKIGGINQNELRDLLNFKGLGYVGQEVFIYNSTFKHTANISKIIFKQSSSKVDYFEFNPALPVNNSFVLNDVAVRPGQIIATPASVTPDQENAVFSFPSGYSNDILNSFFEGGLVSFYKNNVSISLPREVKSITKVGAKSIVLSKLSPQPSQPGDTIELRSAGYGSYTSSFGGTSAAAPVVSGVAALLLKANADLNVLELKHILKVTTDEIDGNYSLETNKNKYNYGYKAQNSDELGTGRVNAAKAVQLAIDWHSTSPSQVIVKPELQIADKLDGGYTGNIIPVGTNDPVDSPDIWIKPLKDTPSDPSVSNPFNTMDTAIDQKIYVRVRNSGDRESFAECDIRVFIAFDNTLAPKFPFPDKWYDQSDVKLIGVKSLDFISPHSDIVVPIEWTKIAANWDNWNPTDTSKNKKSAYILVHIAPFDGVASEVQLGDIRNNKQLTCKKIIVTHSGIKYSNNVLPGNNYDINAATALAQETFSLNITNVLQTELESLIIKATRINGDQEQVINFSRSGNGWVATDPDNPDNPDLTEWIEFEQPQITDSYESNYKNAIFPHKVAIDEQGNKYNVKLEIVNPNA